jgi:hypothetical protein
VASCSSLEVDTTGHNDAAGICALVTNQTGNRNTALGSSADVSLTSGSDNIYIGPNFSGTPRESIACRQKRDPVDTASETPFTLTLSHSRPGKSIALLQINALKQELKTRETLSRSLVTR